MNIKATIYSLAFLGLAGCSEALVQQPEPGNTGIKFSVTVDSGSKMTTDASLHSVFEEGDRVGVYAVLSGSDLAASGNWADNRILTYTSGEWLLEGEPVYLPKEGSLDFYAYYPYMKDFNPTEYLYDASAKSFDFMTSQTLSVSSSSVCLKMEHSLVLIDVNINGGGRQVSLNNAVASTVINLQTGLSNSEQRKSISLKQNGPHSYRQYIPSQTLAAGELFGISAGASRASYSITSEKVLRGGQAYKFNITSPIIDINSLPNCYIVKSGQSVTIPLVKAYELWRQEAWSTEKSLDGAPEAYLLWSDTEGLVPTDGVQVNAVSSDWASSTATVKVAEGKNGNAVIAVKIAGSCRWTWHLWVTDYDPSASSVTFADGLEFMDRNLGASTSDVREVGSYGCYYQACRANPFPGPESNNSAAMRKIYGQSGAEVKVTADKIWGDNQGQSIRRAIKDPLLFVTSGSEPYSWITTDAGATDSAAEFWPSRQTGGVKTAYDPCPEGWMLPTYGDTSPFASLSNYSSAVHGNIAKSGRLKFNGQFDAGGSATMLWCGDATGPKTCALYMSWDSSNNPKEVNPDTNYSRGNALPVRCVKETF